MSDFDKIQSLLQERADCNARINLIPYEGEDINVISNFLKEKCSDCRQSGARTVVLAPFFSVCSNRSPKMIKKSILSSLSYRFFEASLLVFLDSCRQR